LNIVVEISSQKKKAVEVLESTDKFFVCFSQSELQVEYIISSINNLYISGLFFFKSIIT